MAPKSRDISFTDSTQPRRSSLGIISIATIGIICVFLFDTGFIAKWLAQNKDSKLDEVFFVTILLLVVLSAIATRKWLVLSRRLATLEGTAPREGLLVEALPVQTTQRGDLLGLGALLAIATVLVFLFDTGFLAEWIAAHKDTKIDEIIVTTMLLAGGLGVFSIRRSFELSRQLRRYEQLYRTTVKLSREATILGELSGLLQSCVSSDEAYQVISQRAELLLPGSSGALCITANSRNLVEVVAGWGRNGVTEATFAPTDCWALRRGSIQVSVGRATDVNCVHIRRERSCSTVCMPMMAHGETLGLFYIEQVRGNEGGLLPEEFHTSPAHSSQPALPECSDSELRVVRTLGEQIALGLTNLKLRETLSRQSFRDSLTGLYNRRYLTESFDREIARARRKNVPLSVMMIDIDHFKRFNDTFGHEAGDAVLRVLANLFQSHFRGEDIGCRYGGEEFTVMLTDASIDVTRERAEQFRELTKKLEVRLQDRLLEPITVSIGVASFPEDGSTEEELLRAADAALYQAKKAGRDRVVVSTKDSVVDSVRQSEPRLSESRVR